MRAKAVRVFDRFETNFKPYEEARMKTSKMSKKLFVTSIALVTTAAIWATLGARRAQAFQASETFLPYIETIGIASGQTARLNALNTNGDHGIAIDWRFLDGQGRILAQSREPQLIPPGQMRSFDLNADEVNATRDPSSRVQVIAIIRTIEDPDTIYLHTSLEVLDNSTGKTTVFVSPPLIRGINPQTDPSVGQYTWGSAYNLRFGDLNPQPQPPGAQK
jgi:hypothetical protein